MTTTTPSTCKPFYFNTSSHLLRITAQKATTLAEFLDALRACSDDSIFQHSFRTLQEHHFIREGFSNDFAHWVFASCNEPSLAGQRRRARVQLAGRVARSLRADCRAASAARSSGWNAYRRRTVLFLCLRYCRDADQSCGRDAAGVRQGSTRGERPFHSSSFY